MPSAVLRWIGTSFVILGPWVLLVFHLSRSWSIDAEYSYGWAVPFMAAFFFFQKWRTCGADPTQDVQWWAVLAGFAASVLAAVWLVCEAVPDWSVVNWVFALAVLLYLFSLIAFRWGRSAAVHFLFPIAFILCAVPWPQRLELTLVQGLMKAIAAGAAEVLAWLDIPAIAVGNIIQLPVGLVAIDEACSGVRSLQSILMASLFLGELLRLKTWRRLVLILLGLIFALFFNLARTVALAWMATAHGLHALEKWHDPAGFSVLCLSFLLLWLVAQSFSGTTEAQRKTETLGPLQPLPTSLIAGFSGWILFYTVGTEIWYRRSEADSSVRHLSIVWPTDVSGFSKFAISDSARRILLYEDAKCASWRDHSGLYWSFYSLIWKSGRNSTQSARIHRPENCLQGSGAILMGELDKTVVDLSGTPLVFRTYLFERNGLRLHVFYLVWEERNRDLDPNALMQDWSGISRLQRVWLGQRNLGQQSLEIVLSGVVSDEQARTTLKDELGKIVQIRS
jgi:exosortase